MLRESDAGKWFILGTVGLLVTGCSSYTETCLLLFGHEGRAVVVRTYESRSRRTTRLTVEYLFTDGDGRTRREDWTVARRTPVAGPGSAIAIRYSNGPLRTSRLSGYPNWIGLAFSIAALGSIAHGLLVLVRQSKLERESDSEVDSWRRKRARQQSPEPPEYD